MTIEVTAKKVDDAINQGLKQLGASLDEVKVEVLESGGLFRKARVRLTLEIESSESEDKQASAEPAGQAPVAEKPKAVEADSTAECAKTEKTAEDKDNKNSKPSGEAPVAKAHDGAKKPDQAQRAKQQPQAEKNRKPQKPSVENADKPVKTDAHTEKKNPTAAQNDKRGDTAERVRKLDEQDKAAAARALEFVRQTIAKMGFEGATAEADAANPEQIDITAPSGDDSLIIGRHGETLSAISYLAETGARAEKCHINLTVDCNGYRERRAASLSAMARRRANECASKHRKIKLEPMERIDRRTIHNALTDDDRVTTASEGKEPYRYVVILPKDGQGAQCRDGRPRGGFGRFGQTAETSGAEAVTKDVGEDSAE